MLDVSTVPFPLSIRYLMVHLHIAQPSRLPMYGLHSIPDRIRYFSVFWIRYQNRVAENNGGITLRRMRTATLSYSVS